MVWLWVGVVVQGAAEELPEGEAAGGEGAEHGPQGPLHHHPLGGAQGAGEAQGVDQALGRPQTRPPPPLQREGQGQSPNTLTFTLGEGFRVKIVDLFGCSFQKINRVATGSQRCSWAVAK